MDHIIHTMPCSYYVTRAQGLVPRTGSKRHVSRTWPFFFQRPTHAAFGWTTSNHSPAPSPVPGATAAQRAVRPALMHADGEARGLRDTVQPHLTTRQTLHRCGQSLGMSIDGIVSRRMCDDAAPQRRARPRRPCRSWLLPAAPAGATLIRSLGIVSGA